LSAILRNGQRVVSRPEVERVARNADRDLG
jgi:hypothetical protein